MSNNTSPDVRENNRMIAYFDGWVESPYHNLPDKLYTSDLSKGFHIDQSEYHTSWDALMPVVQKALKIDTGSMNTYQLHLSYSLLYADIGKLYEALVDFIKWYNQNKTINP